MNKTLIWTLGTLNDFEDNFKNADAVKIRKWKVKDKRVTGEQKWPAYHSSNTDPDGKYILRPYTIEFVMDEPKDCLFELKIIVTTPRIPRIEININGVQGDIFLNPVPSTSGDLRPKHALHASINSMETIEVLIPAQNIKSGLNSLTITAVDNEDVELVTNWQAVLRLDRMADACGFFYDEASFYEIEEGNRENTLKIISTVVYKKNIKDELIEKCYVYVQSNGTVQSINAQLKLSFEGRCMELPIRINNASIGQYRFPFELPDGEGKVSYEVTGDLSASGSFKRKRKWKVFTMPHAHTDIGYTHRQWEVADRLSRNIDVALENIKKESEAFSYIIDSSWSLEQYLNNRNKKKRDEVLQAIKEGKLGVPSNYVDLLTQFAALEDLIRNGEFSESIMREIGVVPDRADIVDVASATSSLPSVLSGMGVKYLIHANNQDRGPFRSLGNMHRVSPFYWEGPDGSRILVWLAKMYCELKKVCGSPASVYGAENGLQMWLQEYERDDYKPDAVMLYGQEADNTDLDPRPRDFTKKWNEIIEYPKLIPSNGSHFFEYIEENFKEYLSVIKGDEGAYWEDGAASSIIPSIKVRDAQARLKASESLESLAVIHNEDFDFPQQYYDEAWKQVLLYDEHTWGAFFTGTDPYAVLQKDQWAVKEHFSESAHQWANRLILSAAVRHSLNWNNNGREVVVYNPNSWNISGTVRVEVARKEGIFDMDGNEIPFRILSSTATQSYVEIWVDELKGFSYRRFVLKEIHNAPNTTVNTTGEVIKLESKYYIVEIDLNKGGITSWFDKELCKELVDKKDRFELGEFIYAQVDEDSKLLGNYADKSYRPAELLQEFKYKAHSIEKHGFGTTVKIQGSVPMGELEIEIMIHDRAKKLDIEYRYDKAETLAPEAVYISFPFNFERDAEVLSDSQMSWVNWDKETMPGACKEWLPLQTSVLVNGEGAAIQIASPDAFLFTVNDEVKGRWPKELKLSGNRVFSYVLNNYWRTNYKTVQDGKIIFRYILTSSKTIEKDKAYKFGWEARLGLYGHRMSFQEFRESKEIYNDEKGNSFADIGSSNVVVSTIKKARYDEGFVVRLQEISGKNGEAVIGFNNKNIKRAYITDHLERTKIEVQVSVDGSLRLNVSPWSLVSVRIVM